INLIKIDVDGFDMEVLLGASNVLDTFSPIVIIECFNYALNQRGFSEEDIYNFMNSKDYRCTLDFRKTDGNVIFIKKDSL
ncbi:MAG: FkbM family methyltransferase, partial [Nanoarchaeota archaeon]|nr:FkbM family methyltransferase [Nanoarchaeota archaeon]